MTGKKLVLSFLLIVALEMMLVDASPWFWRRRRRRRAAPPPPPPPPKPTTPKPTTPKPTTPTPKPCSNSKPYYSKIKWANDWHQSFYAHCPNGKSLDYSRGLIGQREMEEPRKETTNVYKRNRGQSELRRRVLYEPHYKFLCKFLFDLLDIISLF